MTTGDVTLEDLSVAGSGGTTSGSGGGGSSRTTGSSLAVAKGLNIQGNGDAVVDFGISGFGGSGIYVTAGSVQITGSTISGNAGTGITISASATERPLRVITLPVIRAGVPHFRRRLAETGFQLGDFRRNGGQR